MDPVYVKKADPRQRTTWMDNFVASEPCGGVRDVVEMYRHGRARAVFNAILGSPTARGKVAA